MLKSESNGSYFYRLHVTDDCRNSLMAKALLEYCGQDYFATSQECDEWPSTPAIYKITPHGEELVGGYEQLCELLLNERGV